MIHTDLPGKNQAASVKNSSKNIKVLCRSSAFLSDLLLQKQPNKANEKHKTVK